CLAETGYSLSRIADTQAGVDPAFIDGRRWVDEAMPPGERVQIIASSFGDPAAAYGVWWDIGYWNSSTDRVLTHLATPDLQQPFPEQFVVTPGGEFGIWDAVSIPGSGALGPGPWFVMAASDRTFGFRDAEVVAERFGVLLLRTEGPPKAAWALYGAADDTGRLLAGSPPAELLLFPRDGAASGTVAAKVTLTGLPGSLEGGRFAAGDERGRVAPGEGETATVRVDAPVGEDGTAHVALQALGRPAPAADGQAPRGVQVAGVELLE
ncbi:MAG TPA: hypothetical protein VIL49_15675, partial [Capillimicrobium sp.]